jgi:hypothetical protein
MTEAPKVIAHRTQGAQVSIEAPTFWIELGHLRALVAEADRLSMGDDSTLTLQGVAKSYGRVDELTAKKAILRDETFTKPAVETEATS